MILYLKIFKLIHAKIFVVGFHFICPDGTPDGIHRRVLLRLSHTEKKLLLTVDSRVWTENFGPILLESPCIVIV